MGQFDGVLKDVNKVMDGIKDTLNKATEELNKGLTKSLDATDKAVKESTKNTTSGLKDVQKELQKPFKGIDKLIKDFEDIVITFNKSVPNRFKNLFASIEVIFQDGLAGEIKTLTDSINSGFKGIGYLFAATGELLRTYIMCTIKFIKNLYFCFIFYVVEIALRIFYLPIWLVMWSLKTFLGLDLFWLEERSIKGLEMLNGYTYSLFGFHIIYWPKNVRERCFTCIRLKKGVLKETAKKVDYNFNERIANASGIKMKWAEMVAKKHGQEMGNWPDVKDPNAVRRSVPKNIELPPVKYDF